MKVSITSIDKFRISCKNISTNISRSAQIVKQREVYLKFAIHFYIILFVSRYIFIKDRVHDTSTAKNCPTIYLSPIPIECRVDNSNLTFNRTSTFTTIRII